MLNRMTRFTAIAVLSSLPLSHPAIGEPDTDPSDASREAVVESLRRKLEAARAVAGVPADPTYASAEAWDRAYRDAQRVKVGDVLAALEGKLAPGEMQSNVPRELFGQEPWKPLFRGLAAKGVTIDATSPVRLRVFAGINVSTRTIGSETKDLSMLVVVLRPTVVTRVLRDGQFVHAEVGIGAQLAIKSRAGHYTPETFERDFIDAVSFCAGGLMQSRAKPDAADDRRFTAGLWKASSADQMYQQWRACRVEEPAALVANATRGVKAVVRTQVSMNDNLRQVAFGKDHPDTIWRLNLVAKDIKIADETSPVEVYHPVIANWMKSPAGRAIDEFWAHTNIAWVMQDDVVFDLNGRTVRVDNAILYEQVGAGIALDGTIKRSLRDSITGTIRTTVERLAAARK